MVKLRYVQLSTHYAVFVQFVRVTVYRTNLTKPDAWAKAALVQCADLEARANIHDAAINVFRERISRNGFDGEINAREINKLRQTVQQNERAFEEMKTTIAAMQAKIDALEVRCSNHELGTHANGTISCRRRRLRVARRMPLTSDGLMSAVQARYRLIGLEAMVSTVQDRGLAREHGWTWYFSRMIPIRLTVMF
jgi:hypothetical protein